MPILNVYKPKGLTPLQAITLLREKFPEYKNQTIGFAGRLDPLAHGALVLLVGEETTKQKDMYLNLPKEYEFEAVFGVSTDTYDVLGIVSPKVIKERLDDFRLEDLTTTFIKSKIGKQIQSYPPYSSKTVHGKPLYQWARENKLHEIKIPKREIEIYDFALIQIQEISAEKLESEIIKQINSVDGDFRQKEIKEKWQKFFEENNNQIFTTARLKISCSSGTYVRSLIHELGNRTGMEATVLEILRTKVGSYSVKDSLQFT